MLAHFCLLTESLIWGLNWIGGVSDCLVTRLFTHILLGVLDHRKDGVLALILQEGADIRVRLYVQGLKGFPGTQRL